MEQELKLPCNKSVTWGHLGQFSSHECEDKVKLWCDKIERPSKLQYMHIYGKLHKKSYLMWAIPHMNTYLKLLHEIIVITFLPVLKESAVYDDEWDFYWFPIRDEPLGIPILQKCASIHCELSKENADLVTFTEEILNGKLHILCSEWWKEHLHLDVLG